MIIGVVVGGDLVARVLVTGALEAGVMFVIDGVGVLMSIGVGVVVVCIFIVVAMVVPWSICLQAPLMRHC